MHMEATSYINFMSLYFEKLQIVKIVVKIAFNSIKIVLSWPSLAKIWNSTRTLKLFEFIL